MLDATNATILLRRGFWARRLDQVLHEYREYLLAHFHTPLGDLRDGSVEFSFC